MPTLPLMTRLERHGEGLDRDNGRGSALGFQAPRTPQVATHDGLDVGEQIRRLQALVELRASGILTEGELLDLKQRVLSPGSHAPRQAREPRTTEASRPGEPDSGALTTEFSSRGPIPSIHMNGEPPGSGPSASAAEKKATTASSGVPRPQLNRREPKATYVTTLKVVGTIPITYSLLRNGRASYLKWKEALDLAAAEAAATARPTGSELFSLRIELRLCLPVGQASDMDNYVKPIQDALAERGVFGPPAHRNGPMKGDERVDHLDVRRRHVKSEAKAGVAAEVWGLDP